MNLNSIVTKFYNESYFDFEDININEHKHLGSKSIKSNVQNSNNFKPLQINSNIFKNEPREITSNKIELSKEIFSKEKNVDLKLNNNFNQSLKVKNITYYQYLDKCVKK